MVRARTPSKIKGYLFFVYDFSACFLLLVRLCFLFSNFCSFAQFSRSFYFFVQAFTLILMYDLMTYYVVVGALGMRGLAEAIVAFKRIKVRCVILLQTKV